MMHQPQQARRLQISPRGGPTGSQVTVNAANLPPLTSILIGFGSFSQHQIIARTATDGDGNTVQTTMIPEWAEINKAHFFFWAYNDMQPRGYSEPFHVTTVDGFARVSGEITDEGTSCKALRASGDALYTLVGDTSELKAGAQFVVRGMVVEGTPCGNQGITIAVSEFRPL